MTKRDEAVFKKAFEEMEAKGFFDEIRKKVRDERKKSGIDKESNDGALKDRVDTKPINKTTRKRRAL